ncbi:MAG: LacI family DNA-binding transcriptional regulator [Acidobacteriia bacterium]|nr:LacI family DNA-binding transcriptional regulator [Terriglobia bacterium]
MANRLLKFLLAVDGRPRRKASKMGKPPATLGDIAKSLGTSIGTVHRALHDHPGVSPATRARVLQMARNLGYRPNLAARYLSSKKTLRISVNTLQGTTSFWDEVRAGIREEAAGILLENVEVEFRTSPSLGEGEEEALEAAIAAKVDGIITFPSRPETLRPWIRRASRSHIPVVCVATDAPNSGRLGIVAIDTLASGAIAADLMGKFLGGRTGSVGITVFDMGITEHAEKYGAFESTLKSFYPHLELLKPIEDHDVEREAYRKCRKLFEERTDLAGMYVTTEASIPVLKAACDAKVLDRLTIITTDLFPDLVPYIRSGRVAATIYQRPRAQGQMALRLLHEFLAEGGRRSNQVSLAPHLVMRGNLDFFLSRQSQESASKNGQNGQEARRLVHDLA